MLVLLRQIDESIIITAPDGTRIKVTVIDVRGSSKARIGVEAPRDYIVHRSEIQERIDNDEERHS